MQCQLKGTWEVYYSYWAGNGGCNTMNDVVDLGPHQFPATMFVQIASSGRQPTAPLIELGCPFEICPAEWRLLRNGLVRRKSLLVSDGRPYTFQLKISFDDPRSHI